MVILVRWAVLAVAIAVTTWLFPGIQADGGIGTYLWIALLFSLVNILIGTILRILSAPLIVLTLGLFRLVINALLLLITAWLSDSFDVDGFLTALGGALVISLISMIVDLILGHRDATVAG